MSTSQPAARSLPRPAILTDAEIAEVRRPFRAASLLPGHAYQDPEIFAWERREWFGRDWVCVGRSEDAGEPGTYFLTTVSDEPLVIVRGRDSVLRGFYNVCRHRGTAVVEEPCGKAVRFQCPYHSWIYDLEGRLVRAKHTEDLEDFRFEDYGLVPVGVEEWQGFVFVNLDVDGPPLAAQLGNLIGPEHFGRFEFGRLRRAHSITYEIAANWKFVAENYSECYHCPGVHPQLNQLTPYDVGGDYEPEGAWHGGWMELVPSAETMALSGGHRNGRPAMQGITELDERRIHYYVVWPLLFLSVHPDYLLVHRLEPVDVGHTRVICDWLFDPETMAAPGFDPKDAVGFWDLTNRQDWHVCELQQRGTASRSWTSGRYSNLEDAVHGFDLMCADRYARDGVISRPSVRARYGSLPGETAPAAPNARGTARARAAAGAPEA